MSNSDDEFEEQLRQEAAEKQRKTDITEGKIKVDPDGTAYDWDEAKKAWFPRLDEDFLAKYQMSYGTENVQDSSTTTNPPSIKDGSVEAAATNTETENIPADSSICDPAYVEWYKSYYGGSDNSSDIPFDTNSKEYRDWYNYYYGDTSSDKDEETPEEDKTMESSNSVSKSDSDHSDYYKYYYQHYGQEDSGIAEEKEIRVETPKLDPKSEEYWNELVKQKDELKSSPSDQSDKPEETTTKGAEKGKKRKPTQPPEPPKWFEIDETKNTNVYVDGLPATMSEDGFNELMSKCGMIMFDPHTKKPKTKLYKDEHGNNKGDGRCCYIKAESVDLALQFIDGSDVQGNKISVQRAKFELKGNFDPKKKKKKLSNSQKRKLKERQEKLFDWRPDQPRGARGRHERVVIIKNFFNHEEFEKNPALINEIRQELRDECKNFGEVTKIMVFDRHPDGIASINYKTAEEADVCIEALNRRFYAGRRLIVETWDGKSKFEIEETQEQEDSRLKQWEQFLDDDQNSESKIALKKVDSLENTSPNILVVQPNSDSNGADDKNKLVDIQVDTQQGNDAK